MRRSVLAQGFIVLGAIRGTRLQKRGFE